MWNTCFVAGQRVCVNRPLDCFARSRVRVRLTFSSLWRPIYKITPALHLRGFQSGTPLQNTSGLADTAMPDERDDVRHITARYAVDPRNIAHVHMHAFYATA